MKDKATLVFLTNFASPHTIPIADELHILYGDGFMYIESRQLSKERRDLGYNSYSNRPYVISYSRFINNQEHYRQIINKSDALIASFGSIDNALLNDRLAQDKVTLLMTERLFKKGVLKLVDPKFWKTLKFIQKYKCNKKLSLLCMGAYVAKDFSLCGFPIHQMYKFGYITQPIKIESQNKQNTDVVNILWVGRLIWWKQPFDAIKAVVDIIKKGYKVRFQIVGTGKLSSKVNSFISQLGLSEIEFIGKLPNNEVQRLMAFSDILLCTSNRLEGWGAVVNEGMSMGCVVVANEKMGATKYLIKDGETGFTYKGGWRNLSKTIEIAINADKEEISNNAMNEIVNNWNSNEAARRLSFLIDTIDCNTPPISYDRGALCNKA